MVEFLSVLGYVLAILLAGCFFYRLWTKLNAALERIRNLEARVFENDNSIQLSKRDSEALAKMLLEPAPEPTEALKQAARDYLANKSYGGTD